MPRASAKLPLTKAQKESLRLQGYELLKKGNSQAEVARELGLSRQTVNGWVRRAKKGGKRALKARPHTGRNPKLDRKLLKKLPGIIVEGAEAHGFQGDVWTLERVAEVVRKEFGVEYHPHHVSKLLHKLGLSWKKPKTRAFERDDAAIKEWIEEEWPRLKNAQRSSEH